MNRLEQKMLSLTTNLDSLEVLEGLHQKIQQEGKKKYDGQNYLPWPVLSDMYGYADPEPDSSVAVMDRISYNAFKAMGCNVTLFDRGQGFLESNMKFDVIVGNPPFTAEHSAKRWTLWPKFINHSFDNLSHSNTIIAMVTPTSWMGGGPLFQKFMRYGVSANLDPGKYFVQQGSTFSYWFMKKTPQTGNFIITSGGVDYAINRDVTWLPQSITKESLSINQKVFFDWTDKFHFNRTCEYHTSDKKWQTNNGQYEIFHTLAQTIRTNVKAQDIASYKVMFTLSGYSKPVVKNNTGCSQAAAYMIIPAQHAANSDTVFNTKFYQYLINMNKWSGWNDLKVLKNLPAVDLSRSWTDVDLYSHFNLTDDEIDCIENYV